MSLSFSANQYNQEFTPKRLGMYEIPKQILSKAPLNKSEPTSIIVDQKGHLLPGVKKGESNPFGDFLGTWDLPKTIPGPVQINPTARSGKNLEKLEQQKKETQEAILKAQETQKPLKLRKSGFDGRYSAKEPATDHKKFNSIISHSPNFDSFENDKAFFQDSDRS